MLEEMQIESTPRYLVPCTNVFLVPVKMNTLSNIWWLLLQGYQHITSLVVKPYKQNNALRKKKGRGDKAIPMPFIYKYLGFLNTAEEIKYRHPSFPPPPTFSKVSVSPFHF